MMLEFLYTEGIYYALYMALFISKLFLTKVCMDGGGEQVRKATLLTVRGGGECEFKMLLYVLTPPPPHFNTYTAGVKLRCTQNAVPYKKYRITNTDYRIQNTKYRHSCT
jgi:hypothetical protein